MCSVYRRRGIINPEHLEIARQGKEAINTWQVDHPFHYLDLSDANLSLASLLYTSFCHTGLEGSQFKDARFGYTVIGDCDLSVSFGLEAINARVS